MSTVSIGSNQKYAENWDAIFKKGKPAKKKASANQRSQLKKTASTKKKARATKSAARSGSRKG